jgi:hypothetical protein
MRIALVEISPREFDYVEERGSHIALREDAVCEVNQDEVIPA